MAQALAEYAAAHAEVLSGLADGEDEDGATVDEHGRRLRSEAAWWRRFAARSAPTVVHGLVLDLYAVAQQAAAKSEAGR